MRDSPLVGENLLVVSGAFVLLRGQRRAGQEAHEWGENQSDDEVGEGHGQRQVGQTGAAGHADGGDEPDGGGGGEAVDFFVVDEDQAGADEADAGDYLGGDAGGVEDDAVVDEDVVEAVLRDEQEESGCGAYDGIGAEAGALVADFALEADGGAEEKGQTEFEELGEALPGWFGKDHASHCKEEARRVLADLNCN